MRPNHEQISRFNCTDQENEDSDEASEAAETSDSSIDVEPEAVHLLAQFAEEGKVLLLTL